MNEKDIKEYLEDEKFRQIDAHVPETFLFGIEWLFAEYLALKEVYDKEYNHHRPQHEELRFTDVIYGSYDSHPSRLHASRTKDLLYNLVKLAIYSNRDSNYSIHPDDAEEVYLPFTQNKQLVLMRCPSCGYGSYHSPLYSKFRRCPYCGYSFVLKSLIEL